MGQIGDGAEKDAGKRAEHHPCVEADDDEGSKALDGVVIKASLEDEFFCDIADGSGEAESGEYEQEEKGGEARESACESLVLGDASDIKAGFGKPENAEHTAKNDGDHRKFDGAVMEVAAVGSKEKRHPKGKKGEVLVEGKGAQGVLGEGDQGEVKGVEQKDDEQDFTERLEQMEQVETAEEKGGTKQGVAKEIGHECAVSGFLKEQQRREMQGSQTDLKKQRKSKEQRGEKADLGVWKEEIKFVEGKERGLVFEREIGVEGSKGSDEQKDFGGLKEEEKTGLTGCCVTDAEFQVEREDQQKKRDKEGQKMGRQEQEREGEVDEEDQGHFLDVVQVGGTQQHQKEEQEREEAKQESLVGCAGDAKARPSAEGVGRFGEQEDQGEEPSGGCGKVGDKAREGASPRREMQRGDREQGS